MNTKNLIGAIGLLTASLMSAACDGHVSALDGVPASSEATHASSVGERCMTVKMHASWGEYYRSISALKEHAAFAVRATVAAISDAAKPERGPVYEMVTVQVSDVLWQAKDVTDVPKEITFEQTGGEFEGVLYELEEDPLPKANNEIVVFFSVTKEGKYKVTGGPTGRFAVGANGIESIVEDGVKVPSGTTAQALLSL